MSETEDKLGLGEALAALIDTFTQRREEWIRVYGTDAGFSEWCAERVHGV